MLWPSGELVKGREWHQGKGGVAGRWKGRKAGRRQRGVKKVWAAGRTLQEGCAGLIDPPPGRNVTPRDISPHIHEGVWPRTLVPALFLVVGLAGNLRSHHQHGEENVTEAKHGILGSSKKQRAGCTHSNKNRS